MSNPRVNSVISIENARIGFRNFSGKEGQYNPAGRRNFCVFLESELGRTLEEDGWNVRYLRPKDDQEEEQAYLQVAVNYDNIPPRIVLITSRGKTILEEDTVSLLDWAEVKTIDLIIRPYNWVVQPGTKNEKSGVKAYLKSMYVEIVEDEFEKKWASVPNETIVEED